MPTHIPLCREAIDVLETRFRVLSGGPHDLQSRDLDAFALYRAVLDAERDKGPALVDYRPQVEADILLAAARQAKELRICCLDDLAQYLADPAKWLARMERKRA
jgi:hypothetical protein